MHSTVDGPSLPPAVSVVFEKLPFTQFVAQSD